MRNSLTRRLNLTLRLVDRERYRPAMIILENWVLPKMDGCAEAGEPDEGLPLYEYDWLVTCDAQDQVYPLIIDTIDLLDSLM